MSERGAEPRRVVQFDPLRLDDLARACRRVDQTWARHEDWRRERGGVDFEGVAYVGVDLWMGTEVSHAIRHLLQVVGVSAEELLLWFPDAEDAEDAEEPDE
jgi:hypothetical protein